MSAGWRATGPIGPTRRVLRDPVLHVTAMGVPHERHGSKDLAVEVKQRSVAEEGKAGKQPDSPQAITALQTRGNRWSTRHCDKRAQAASAAWRDPAIPLETAQLLAAFTRQPSPRLFDAARTSLPP